MKRLLTFGAICLFFSLLTGLASAQTTETKTQTYNSGSGTWTAPAGAWKVTKVEAWGGGGGGGSCTSNNRVGSGGGGGAYSANATVISAIPFSTSLEYSVGAGGNAASAGNPSFIKYNGVNRAVANGGGAGTYTTRPNPRTTNTANGGAGGTASDGTTNTSGSNGSNATITRTLLSTTYSNSGAGGAGANGGAGGAARSSDQGGANGTAPGGGGSGARRSGSSSGTFNGGTGASGRVTITYELLTITITLDENHDAGNISTFDILYYDTYGDNLPVPTREGYLFLGWFTDPQNGSAVTSNTQCTSTTNTILYAHWASAGSIVTGQTTLTDPCLSFTVYSQTLPDASITPMVYSWTYAFNNEAPVTLNANVAELTEDEFTPERGGDYVFTRFVTALGQTVASSGQYTLHASYTAGSIVEGEKYICASGSFNIVEAAGSDYTPATYQWRYTKDGGPETSISNSNMASINEGNLSLETGTYVFKRYVKTTCTDWVASDGSYTLHVVDLPSSLAAPTVNYSEFCVGGILNLTSEEPVLTGVPSPYNVANSQHWIISTGGTPQTVDGSTSLEQILYQTGTYTISKIFVYFNQAACSVTTPTVTVTVAADPTLDMPTLSSTNICPNGEVTLTSATPAGGVGGEYSYNWEFKAAGATEWRAISANEATYNQYEGSVVNASNFFETGDVQFRTYANNQQGCDAHSDAVSLHIIEVPTPIVRGDTTVCPVAGQTIAFKAETTNPNFSLRWYENENTTISSDVTPSVPMDNEIDTTHYVAQYNPENGCVSARIPDAIYITYSAHLQYVDAAGELNQAVCQNSPIDDIQFNHGGDCEPSIEFTPHIPEGISIDYSANGMTAITGTPSEVGEFSYHVALLPGDNTRCAAPNTYDGIITIHPTYMVTDVQSLCGGSSYTMYDTKGFSETFNTTGVYTRTLQTVDGCDSVVTLDLYVGEWNQFGYREESLIAGWTNFSSVSSPISADVSGSASGSQITYSGWYGSNTSDDNLASSTPFINGSGHSLGLVNGTSTGIWPLNTINLNNNKSLVIKTSTEGYSHVKLAFDYGVDATSSTDQGFTNLSFKYSVDGVNYSTISSSLSIDVSNNFGNRTTGSFIIDLSNLTSNIIDNQNAVFIQITFDGASKTSNVFNNSFLLDNICFSGTKAIDEIALSSESNIVCTNQGIMLSATPPYINNDVTPAVITPVNYSWERVANGVSTPLDGHDYYFTDESDDIPVGDYQYVVSVGQGACVVSDTLDVTGVAPAYRLDIVRHGTVCANEVDQVSNITFTDECQYVDGMFIITPSVEEMRNPGTYTCQLSIPTTENPCDSVITLELEVFKAFDTTLVAYICLGESYTDYGFNVTPTEEGVTYLTSPASWTCSTGCDSIYRVTLVTNSVQQTLTSEYNVTLAAWNMDNGINDYQPTCGVRTQGATFSVNNTSVFTNVSGVAPSNDYCYTTAANNGALQWANLSSSCSPFLQAATYTYHDGVYFELKLNPKDYNNLKLKFDYQRENNNGGAAFNNVNYSYKTSENGSYTNLGSKAINGTSWSTAEFDLSSISSLDVDQLFLKLEFTGGSAGNTQSCGVVYGSRYLPSFITVDNLMVWGDRPARATLDGTLQTCDKQLVCEGDNVTFTCQGDDDYFEFFLLDGNTLTETPFAGNTSLTIMPDTTTTYTIKALDLASGCDSIWTFDVEVVKEPSLSINAGSLDAGLCGNATFENDFMVENAVSYSLTWLTDGNVVPDGIIYNDDQQGHITMGGTLTNGGSARYTLTAEPDSRCPFNTLAEIGTISVRIQPQIIQTLGNDTVCQGTLLQFVVDTTHLNFALVPESDRYRWYTANSTLGTSDTLTYTADEATHSTRHYVEVNQNGCTTVDSFDIVVFDLSAATIDISDHTFVLNYGERYLREDSLIVPSLMRNGELIPDNLIASVTHTGGSEIYAPSMDNMNTQIEWTITDICGNTYTGAQNLHFVLPPCGDNEHYTVNDWDGNEYHTVRVGWDCWIRENIRSEHYANGDEIAKAMVYVNDYYPDATANAENFGRLYTWYSALNIPENSSTEPTTDNEGHIQGVCPEGWCLPTSNNYAALQVYEMDNLRSQTYWLDGGGNNSTNMTLQPAGFYNNSTMRFENLLDKTYLLTTDIISTGEMLTFVADCNCYMFNLYPMSKQNAVSVRCIKKPETNIAR
jgi:Listeria/Bacterioides repeat